MSNLTSSLYTGHIDQRFALRAVLQALNASDFSDQKITDLFNDYLEKGSIPEVTRQSTRFMSRPTVQRLRTASDDALHNFRRGTLRKLYNFLSCCEELPSELYSKSIRIQSAHGLAPLLQAVQGHMGAKDGPLNNRKLKSLAGTFHLLRDAWTSPNDETFIQCIVRFEWVGDALFYTEEQKFFDTVAGLPVDERDTGIALPFGMNVVLIGRGQSKDLLKFFSIDDFDNFPDGHLKVHAFSGNFIAVYGKGPHPGFRAVAKRVDAADAETKFVTASDIDPALFAQLTS